MRNKKKPVAPAIAKTNPVPTPAEEAKMQIEAQQGALRADCVKTNASPFNVGALLSGIRFHKAADRVLLRNRIEAAFDKVTHRDTSEAFAKNELERAERQIRNLEHAIRNLNDSHSDQLTSLARRGSWIERG